MTTVKKQYDRTTYFANKEELCDILGIEKLPTGINLDGNVLRVRKHLNGTVISKRFPLISRTNYRKTYNQACQFLKLLTDDVMSKKVPPPVGATISLSHKHKHNKRKRTNDQQHKQHDQQHKQHDQYDQQHDQHDQHDQQHDKQPDLFSDILRMMIKQEQDKNNKREGLLPPTVIQDERFIYKYVNYLRELKRDDPNKYKQMFGH